MKRRMVEMPLLDLLLGLGQRKARCCRAQRVSNKQFGWWLLVLMCASHPLAAQETVNRYTYIQYPDPAGQKALDVKNPSWKLRKGSQYAMCRDLETLLNDLPGDKHLGFDFPFSDKYPKFQPVPMKAVRDVTPFLPVLNEWWDKYYSRFRPPKGSTLEQWRQKHFDDWRKYADSPTPLLFEGYVDLAHDGTKVHVLWRRDELALPNPDKYWWENLNTITNLIVIDSDGTMDDRSARGDTRGYPIYYEGRYRAVDWGGGWPGWRDKPIFNFSAGDVRLTGLLFRTTVCNIVYHFELEN